MRTLLLLGLLRLGEHKAAITDEARHVVFRTRRAADLKGWLEHTYPNFVAQLDQPVYTRFPHPSDGLGP